ncbi:MAG: ATP-binding protein [Tabrizicola sp.]|jgi:serine/threonine-protein kinase RsbW|nr:ATP-binding protein [Tabrizicola sp.]
MLPAHDPFAQADTHDLVLRADPLSVRSALQSITSVPPVSQLTHDQRATVELVLAEVLNNVAEHAYAEVAGHVAVTIVLVPGGMACEVVDEGGAMPGGTLPEGQLPDDALAEGGFGWHLIRTLTKDLSYRRQRGTNRLNFLIPLSDL